MAVNESSLEPLLETRDNFNHGEKETKCWKKVLFSLPMIVTNASYYAIPLVSVMFAGHHDELELAGATLANSWAIVTGFPFMVIRHLINHNCSIL